MGTISSKAQKFWLLALSPHGNTHSKRSCNDVIDGSSDMVQVDARVAALGNEGADCCALAGGTPLVTQVHLEEVDKVVQGLLVREPLQVGQCAVAVGAGHALQASQQHA